MQKKILYISYDGMTDPLGQSQVIPYLIGLRKKGYEFVLLSCEKKERYAQHQEKIQTLLTKHNITWEHIWFTKSPPIVAKFWDLYQLHKKALQLHQKFLFDMTHCRSYVSADVGWRLKQKFGVKFLFDMRGFWVDERVDGGLWNLRNPIYRLAYHWYKKKEATYIEQADALILLTEAGTKELMTWPSYQKNQPLLKVIPCSADFDHFQVPSPQEKQAARKTLGLAANSLVITYLGSIGTWYLLDEMLAFFVRLKKIYPTVHFVLLTPESPDTIHPYLVKHSLSQEDISITFAPRNRVPFLLAASDISLFFIKPSYSKIASSPTKLGELLAMGIPVICNANVGDVEQIVHFTKGGLAIQDFTTISFQEAIAQIPFLLQQSADDIRAKAFSYYDLQKAIQAYAMVYQQLLP